MRKVLMAMALFGLFTLAQAVDVAPVWADNNGAGQPSGSDAGWTGGGWGG